MGSTPTLANEKENMVSYKCQLHMTKPNDVMEAVRQIRSALWMRCSSIMPMSEALHAIRGEEFVVEKENDVEAIRDSFSFVQMTVNGINVPSLDSEFGKGRLIHMSIGNYLHPQANCSSEDVCETLYSKEEIKAAEEWMASLPSEQQHYVDVLIRINQVGPAVG